VFFSFPLTGPACYFMEMYQYRYVLMCELCVVIAGIFVFMCVVCFSLSLSLCMCVFTRCGLENL
jgi:hypothetical protein